MKIYLKQLDGSIFEVEISPKATVLKLKAENEKLHQFPIASQRIVYAGKHLEDCKTLEECEIGEETTLHLVVLPVPSQQSESSDNLEEKVKPSESNESISAPNNQNPVEVCPSSCPDNVLKYGSLIHLIVNGEALSVVNREVLLDSHQPPAAFFLHLKHLNNLTLLGFQNAQTKEFLFSAPPHQSIFHGKYGQSQVYCRYPFFSFGEEMVMDEVGRIQAYRNQQYLMLKDNKLFTTPQIEQASRFQIKKLQ